MSTAGTTGTPGKRSLLDGMAVVLLGLLLVGGASIMMDKHKNSSSSENMAGATTSSAPVQAGFPGNTLAPVKPYTATPSPASESHTITMNWPGIPMGTKKVWVGVDLKPGPYQRQRTMAYFPLLQTPPTQQKIYGDLSLFVEGGRVGMKIGNDSVITGYKFDMNRRTDYRIEMVIEFISAFTTRVSLVVDGGVTGEEMVIRKRDLASFLQALPEEVHMYSIVQSSWLQAEKPEHVGYYQRDIKEIKLN